ncbi:MAG: DMT family transporter [Zoogloeaceae bacterium]|jgi:drug/metabolite transporter (DMT)-like permease|nr:DMT family transporter [Zoogloeaceae bacterium]
MPARKNAVALVSLLAGAVVWGLTWHPYRTLESMGVSAALGAVLTYCVAFLLGLFVLRRRLSGEIRGFRLRSSGLLLAITLTAGGCNLGYVLGTVHGEVMRVLLLFYLAPLWTVLLARLLLDERVGGVGAAVIALSLIGAIVMLWSPSLGLPLPANGAEWLGLAAGFLFAAANVLIRKADALSIELKSMAVFTGVILMGLIALPFEAAPPALPPPGGWLLIGIVGLVLLAINLVVQHGLMHTPANRAIVIFLFELVVAAFSSWLLAGEAMSLKEWIGGAMIVAASLFSGKLAAREAEPG